MLTRNLPKWFFRPVLRKLDEQSGQIARLSKSMRRINERLDSLTIILHELETSTRGDGSCVTPSRHPVPHPQHLS